MTGGSVGMVVADNLERLVLGSLIGSGSAAYASIACETLEPNDFHHTARATLFEMAQRMCTSGQPISTALLIERLRPGRPAGSHRALWDELEECFRASSLPMVLEAFSASCTHLRNIAVARNLQQVCLRVAAEAADGIEDPASFLDRTQQSVIEAVSRRADAVQYAALGDVVTERHAAALKAHADPAAGVGGLSTGLRGLDHVLGGIRRGKLCVVAGRPGMGKSALTQHIGRAIAGFGHRVLMFSLEMPADELGERMLGTESSVTAQSIATGRLSSHELERLVTGAEKLKPLPMLIALKLQFRSDALVRAVRTEHHRAPVGLVIVDYLQLMSANLPPRASRENHVSEITRALKLCALENGLPVIAVSQLNRAGEGRTDKRPQLSELRESGSIEQDADQVVFVYRDDYYERESKEAGKCELIVAKNRGGKTGTATALFDPPHTRFHDMFAGDA